MVAGPEGLGPNKVRVRLPLVLLLGFVMSHNNGDVAAAALEAAAVVEH
jgi:hypothetical protein